MAVVGDLVHIVDMSGEPQYAGAEGRVTRIDDAGQIHGTWGGCALIPDEDSFYVVSEAKIVPM